MIEETIIKLKNNRTITIQPYNAYAISIKTNHPLVQIENMQSPKQKEIASICIEENTFKVGESFKVNWFGRKTNVDIVKITKISNEEYIINTHCRNYSTYYLTPILGKTSDYFDWNNTFVSTYVFKQYSDDTDIIIVRDQLHLLYRFADSDDYSQLEEKFKEHPLYIDKEDYGNFVLYSFVVPEDFKIDVDNFVQGKYSCLSKDLQKKIRAFHIPQMSKQYLGIINQTDEIHKQLENKLHAHLPKGTELCSIPNLKEETYERS